MLDTIFLQIFDMSKVASLVILVVLLVRLCLKRAPKVISYVLWAVVLFRLLCPVSIEAPISLIPHTEPTIQSYNLLNEPITPLAAIDAAQQAVGDVLNGGIGIQHVHTTAFDEDGTRRVISTDWSTVWILFTKFVWLGGMAALIIYSTISLIRLKRRLVGAILLRDNIYLADYIDSPFVMGLIRPKIYLPSSLSAKERAYIILHEQHHIRRGDHMVKLLFFAALCLHCFNPLVWIAFTLFGKDMEMSCDEAVLRKLGEEIRVDYSASLINLATGRRIIAGAPLAFGEGNTEGRIRNIAGWKKPAVWVIVIAVIVCVVLAVCLMTNPMNRDTLLLGAEYKLAEDLYLYKEEFASPEWKYYRAWSCIGADYSLWAKAIGSSDWSYIGTMEPYAFDNEMLAEMTPVEDGWIGRRPGKITDAYILRFDTDFYLFCQTNRGEVLYGAGREEFGLRFLLRLESTFDGTHLTGEFHERSLTQTVGGDVEIFHTHYDERHPHYMIVGFLAGEAEFLRGSAISMRIPNDMGFAVFYQNKDESGYQLLQCHVYEDAFRAENGIFLCPDQAVLNLSRELVPKQTYDVIFIHNSQIARAERVWEYTDGTEKTQDETYLNGQQMLLYSWEYDRPGCRVWQYFYDEDGGLIDYSSIVNHSALEMIPTTANVSGAFDSYLYVPIDGANYRYERIYDDPASVTKGDLMHTFTEEADPQNVVWHVYAVEDYPDRSVVLAEAGEDYVHLYRHSPPKAADPAQLKQAKKDGKIVLENGYATSGQARWNTFCEQAEQGKQVSADIVHYHTLHDPGQYSETYYAVYQEDYPALYAFELTFDGSVYTMKWNEYGTAYVRTYKYLRKFEDTLPTTQSAKKPQKVTRYVLTNDNKATLDELWRGVASSQFGDYIDFYTIYSVKN